MKKNNQKQTTIKIGFSAMLVGLAFILATVLVPDDASLDKTRAAGISIPITQLGEKIILDEARQQSQFAIKVPTNLPQSSMKDVFSDKNGTWTLILYSKPGIQSINRIGGTEIGSAEIVVAMEKTMQNPILGTKSKTIDPIKVTSIDHNTGEQTVTYIEQTLADFIPLTVNGVEAIGLESLTDDSGEVQPATIRWWDKDTLYTIYAHVPLKELVSIAESMR